MFILDVGLAGVPADVDTVFRQPAIGMLPPNTCNKKMLFPVSVFTCLDP